MANILLQTERVKKIFPYLIKQILEWVNKCHNVKVYPVVHNTLLVGKEE